MIRDRNINRKIQATRLDKTSKTKQMQSNTAGVQSKGHPKQLSSKIPSSKPRRFNSIDILVVGILLHCSLTILVFEFKYQTRLKAKMTRIFTTGVEDEDPQQQLKHQSTKLMKQKVKITASTTTGAEAEDGRLPFSFSACLLIKDNNIILPEWLAYHYTLLPLRRLIVAIDPLSLTDPKPIFDLYETIGMNITVWTNDSFWSDGMDGSEAHEKKAFQITNETDHETLRWHTRHRQKVFYKSCLQQLHDEMRTWTLLVDTDEYLAFNYYDEQEGAPTFCEKNASCAEEYAKSIENGTHLRTKLDSSPTATAAEHISKGVDTLFDTADKPCIIFGRYLFISKDSNSRDEIQKGVDSDFNATLFHTLRYRQRSSLSSMQLGKSIVDVSRYDGRDIENVHRPLGGMCTGGGNAYVHNAAMSFRVHHYIGSWETFRQPGFDRRGKSFFTKRNRVKNVVVDNTTPRYSPTQNSTWLTQFSKLVGKEKALQLTQEIRIREELQMEKVMIEMANGAQLYDWDKLNQKPEKIKAKTLVSTSNLKLSQNMTDQGLGGEKSLHYCGHLQWMNTTMSCDQRVWFLTLWYQMTLDGARQSAMNDNCTCEGESENNERSSLGEEGWDDDDDGGGKNMIDPSDHQYVYPHIDRKTRSLLEIKPFFRGEEVANRSDGITAVTQMTAGTTKLQRLQDLASRWSDDGGYISVAIYVPDDVAANNTSKSLRTYFQENSVLFKRTVVQLVIDERPKGYNYESSGRSPHEYPVNILRNNAVDAAPTEHIIYIDVDFIPSVGAHSHLRKQFSLMDASEKKMALIVPAFERKLSKREDESASIESLLLPSQKSDLLPHVTGSGSHNIIAPFHLSEFSMGHGPTEYHRWYTAVEPYEVEYAYKFEPYFVINKNGVPPFWEFFQGRRFNKWSWVGELSLAGYKFHVDPSCFLIHINHKYVKDKKHVMQRNKNKQEFEMRFNNGYLRETYGRILEMANVLSFPKSDKAFIASGEEGSLFSRVYYRANTTHCFEGSKAKKGISNTEWLRILTFADGMAAGPIIDCAPNDDVSCDLESALSDLEVIQSLRRGQSFQFFLPHQDLGVHDVIQVTRMRKSSSTGVVFLDGNHLAVVSYGMKRIYLYQYDFDMAGSKSARLLASVNTASNPDLMHVDLKRNMLVASLFMEGTQQLFKYDLGRESLEAIKEVAVFGPKVKNQWCHEAAFYPSDTSSIIAAGSSKMRDKENVMISIFDYEHERVIAQYLMMANDATRGYKAQGLRFVDERHMIVALSRAPVSKYDEKKMCQMRPHLKSSDANVRIALIRLEFSVDDIAASGGVEPVSSSSFSIIGVHDIGVGALDGIDYHDGMAMVADQLNDRVLFFEVNTTASNETLKLVSQQRGYILPHGVAFSKSRDHFAVTTYGDNSVIVSRKDSIRALSRDAIYLS